VDVDDLELVEDNSDNEDKYIAKKNKKGKLLFNYYNYNNIKFIEKVKIKAISKDATIEEKERAALELISKTNPLFA
jgi:hypothetical protein